MKTTYRKIESKDNVALAQMIRTVFEEHDAPKEGTVYSDPTTDDLSQLFKTPKSILWIAEIENNAVGCCGIYPTKGLHKNCAELVKFYLSKDTRGMGIGKTLMQKTIYSAKELGYTEIYLESLPIYAKAIEMYILEGFKKLEKPLGESGHTSCDVWMLKKL